MAHYDIVALERALEQAEEADGEAHKLLNNLGLAHAADGRPRAALRAHREEKRACKRLAAAPGAPPAILVDLAIAYRRCGDAMLKLDALELGGGGAVVTARVDIARRAHEQHARALRTAVAAARAGVPAAAVEVQAASAAMSQSVLIVAMDTKEPADFEAVAGLCGRAAALADRLTDAEAGGRRARASMLLSAAVNLAIAVSGLGDRKRARTLFEAVAVRARDSGDALNLMRGIANLAEEAGDDGDWDLCLDYVDEWVAFAKEERDEGEEGEALRKRGTALFESHRYEEARVALDRAALLGRDESAREEARRFLELVESELEDLKAAETTMAEATAAAVAAASNNEGGDTVAEAKARITAGEAAFRLRRDNDVLEHLGRYFVLVEDYGSGPTATGVAATRHCSAVANMAETLWRGKRFGEAVEWGMKELAVYKDDVAGQAQAWCNIGVYLDDDGKFEAAKEALNTSMALAEEAGDAHLRQQAEMNLKVVIENQAEKEAAHEGLMMDSGENDAIIVDTAVIGGGSVQHSVADPSRTPRGVASSSVARDDQSIVVDSDGNSADGLGGGGHQIHGGRQLQLPHATTDRISPHDRRCGNPAARYTATTSRSAPDRSSAGSRRFIDLAALFRKHCEGAPQQTGSTLVAARSMLTERLRQISAKLVACDDGDVVAVDFSATFLGDDEFPPLLRTLAALPVHEPQLLLNLRLNPLLSPASVRWLSSVSSVNGPPRSLPAVSSLDLSGTGIDASCLAMLARALSPVGTLPHVKNLVVGKNALGEHAALAADAVSRLLLQSSQLQSLDLSLNLLSHTFLIRLVDSVEKLSAEQRLKHPSSPPLSVTSLDMRLNNRCHPTALLEESEAGYTSPDAPANLLSRLVEAVPSLRSIDVRACGAGDSVRRRLFELRSALLKPRDAFLAGHAETDDSVELVVVSPNVYDPVQNALHV